MFTCETQMLQRLAVLVVCHGLSYVNTLPHYILVQRAMSWFEARGLCQRHYVDLAVLSTQEDYFSLLNVTAEHKVSFWLGLQRQTVFSQWQWVDGEELSYEKWFRRNYQGHCTSLEAMFMKEKKLLARYCHERHMVVCQGPVSPQQVVLDSVGSDNVVLSWNVSAFMQTTSHSYNVTICNDTCDTLIYPYVNGSTLMTISIFNLTAATKFNIQISASVGRVDSSTGGRVLLQSDPAALQVETMESPGNAGVVIIMLKILKLVSLAPPLWVIYHMLKKYYFIESDLDFSEDPELPSLEIQVELIPEKTGGIS